MVDFVIICKLSEVTVRKIQYVFFHSVFLVVQEKPHTKYMAHNEMRYVQPSRYGLIKGLKLSQEAHEQQPIVSETHVEHVQ